MLSLLFDFIIHFVLFLVLAKGHVFYFAAGFSVYYALMYLRLKRLPRLSVYIAFLGGALLLRQQLPALWEWCFLAALSLFHMYSSSRTKHLGMIRVGGILAAAAAGFLSIWLWPIAAGIIKFLVSGAAYLIANLLARPLMFLFNLFSGESERERSERMQAMSAKMPKYQQDLTNSTDGGLWTYIIFITLGAAFFIFLYIQYKKKKRNGADPVESRNSILGSDQVNAKGLGISGSKRPPKDSVRKIVYSFEKKLSGRYGRMSGETFASWVSRLSMDCSEKVDTEFLIATYSQTRYNDSPAGSHDARLFKQEMNKLASLKE
ncbi:hypothetical protein V1498_08780 [Peribacillus sp. SCS-26]|uniref:hypothetical protein n=1 Tax=Paraperibacillus marinus TaxID=3115295 RepID=UPI0039066C1D